MFWVGCFTLLKLFSQSQYDSRITVFHNLQMPATSLIANSCLFGHDAIHGGFLWWCYKVLDKREKGIWKMESWQVVFKSYANKSK
jgi:hypothetical protein